MKERLALLFLLLALPILVSASTFTRPILLRRNHAPFDPLTFEIRDLPDFPTARS
jgi:hypothetical protein